MALIICQICFCENPSPAISTSCCNSTCDRQICEDCMERLLDYCEREDEYPLCPACQSEYLLDSFAMSKPLESTYVRFCSNKNSEDYRAKVQSKATQLQLIQKIRNEKKAFLEQSFPKAITYIIDVAMKSEVNKINRTKRQELENKAKSTKKCLHLTCCGILDVNMKCDKCQSTFCNKCEQIMPEQISTHVCNKENILSVKYVATLVKCPKCLTPATKSYGCMFLTCPICSTHFDENTGQKTSVGNHQDLRIELEQNTLPSKLYVNIYPENIIEWFVKIEATMPSVPNANWKMSNDPMHICKRYQTMRLDERKNKMFYRKLQTIERMHNEKQEFNNQQMEKLFNIPLL